MSAAIRRAALGLGPTRRHGRNIRSILSSQASVIFATGHRNVSWGSFFKGSKVEKPQSEDNEMSRELQNLDNWDAGVDSLKKKRGLCSVRGYTPPEDVERRVMSVLSSLVGSSVSSNYSLSDRHIKFHALTQLEREFDHVVPNTQLNSMTSVSDIVDFFSTPVADRSALEDMSKLNLPKNLHIQLEPLRFNPDTDTFFDGKTAFPGSPTVVSSLKYGRVYSGTSGESRNTTSRTNYEEQMMLDEDRIKYMKRWLPSEGVKEKRPTVKKSAEYKIPII